MLVSFRLSDLMKLDETYVNVIIFILYLVIVEHWELRRWLPLYVSRCLLLPVSSQMYRRVPVMVYTLQNLCKNLSRPV